MSWGVLGGEVEEVDGFGLYLAVVADVFEQDARGVVSQQELF